MKTCIHVFDPTTNSEITAIYGTSDKTCVMDPLSANQLRDNITRIVSVITLITNASKDEAIMPRPHKHAIVRPSLKEPSFYKDIPSNYRPVSNLTQFFKVIAKVVALRTMTHVSDQQIVECFKLAYREKKHWTETALLYVTSAIKTAMDNKQGTTSVLVDFSAVFDTINHDILIRRLRLLYGFVGKALDWVISYLQEQTQRVVIDGQSSSTTTLTAGVPQGSFLCSFHCTSSLMATLFEPMDYSSTTGTSAGIFPWMG